MKSRFTILGLAFSLIAAPVLAQATQDGQAAPTTPAPPAAEPQAAAAPAEPDPGEEIICRRDRATGSLTRVNRVCKTRNEWNGVYDNTRDNMNDLQRNASGGAACRQDQMGGC